MFYPILVLFQKRSISTMLVLYIAGGFFVISLMMSLNAQLSKK